MTRTPVESHDYVTVLTHNKPANKEITLGTDGKPIKGMANARDNFVTSATTEHVPNADALADVLRAVGQNPNQCVILGYVPELIGERFTIRAISTLHKALGATADVRGVHRLEGVDLPVVARVKETFSQSSWILIDRDITPGMPEDLAEMGETEYLQALEQIMPGITDAERVVVPSTTRRVSLEGQPLQAHGLHYYIKVADPDDVARFRQAVFPRAHLAGLGFVKSIAGGGKRPWTIFDPSVFSPERLVFDGKPVVSGDGLEVAEPIVSPAPSPLGDELDTSLVKDLSPDEAKTWENITGLRNTGRAQYRDDGLTLDTVVPVMLDDSLHHISIAEFLDMGEEKLRANSPDAPGFRASGSLNYILRLLPSGLPMLYDNGVGMAYFLTPEDERKVLDRIVAEGFDFDEPDDPDDPDDPDEPEPDVDELFGSSEEADSFSDDFVAEDAGEGKGAARPTQASPSDGREEEPVAVVERKILKILDSDDTDSSKLKRCCRVIARNDLDPIDSELAVNLLAGRTGATKPMINKQIKAEQRADAPSDRLGAGDAPPTDWAFASHTGGPRHWTLDWVWNTSTEKFHDINTGLESTIRAFDLAQLDRMPMDENGKRGSASELVMAGRLIPRVQGARYSPGSGLLYEEDGAIYVNAYRSPGCDRLKQRIEEEQAGVTAPTLAEQGAISRFQTHLRLLVPDERERQLLINWVGWVLTHPGQKILWAPLIQGKPGAGKSILFNFMAKIVGDDNTRLIRSQELSSEFNTWASGSVLACFEEVYVGGKDNRRLMNTLKEVITNSRVVRREMRQDPVSVVNTVNYLLLTNHKDALPIDEGDRRWMVIYSPFHPPSSAVVREAGGETAYFRKLTDEGVFEHPIAVASWAARQPVHADFTVSGRAPKTISTKAMANQAVSHMSQLVRGALEGGRSHYFSGDYAHVGSLVQYLKAENDEISRVSGAEVKKILSNEMGFSGAPVHIQMPGDATKKMVYYRYGGFPADASDKDIRAAIRSAARKRLAALGDGGHLRPVE